MHPTPTTPQLDTEIVSEDFVAPIRELFYGRSLDLPLVPASVARVLELCNQDAPSMDEVSAQVALDQSLAAHILRLAGSASMAPVTEIKTIEEAVRRVGTRAIGDMAISHLVTSSLGGQDDPRILDQLKRSAIAGVYAFRIGRLVGGHAQASLLPGLLHDIGRPMVLGFLLDMEQTLGEQLGEVALDYLVESLHVDLGVRLAQAWHLPVAVEVAIRYHADYNAAPVHATEAMIANLSDLLARWTLDPESTAHVDLPALDVVQRLGLGSTQLGRLMANLGEVLEAAAAFD